MKFSYQWIEELTVGLKTDPRELARDITMKTAECEGVEEVAPLLREASVARVISAEPMGDGHNRRVVAETEKYGTKTVVCGAPNCRPGVITVYVPLATKRISGVDSEGMLASGAELGINRDAAGIVELESDRLTLAPDSIIDVDNKSLTHRPDLWGHHGMAREVAAIEHVPLRDPVNMKLLPDPSVPPAIRIAIPDLNLCPRYSALVFDNVTVKPSPLWLQYRLEAIGLNPINNVVDVTNYVMSAIAQPMHAFDADKLHGDTIFARRARPGESILALNDQHYNLTPANLVIADAGGPIAIGGVIGGADSAISDRTTRIVLESANFQAASVRRTSVALKLRTDASMRFEKSQDPLNTVRGLALAIQLLTEVSPGIRIVGGVADLARPLTAPAPIALSVPWLIRRLGRTVEQSQVETILGSLGFMVLPKEAGVLSVTVPSWRATKDVSIADDLLEEVGRMLGYNSITPQAPRIETVVPPPNPGRELEHRVREILVDQGFTEVHNYSFVTEEEVRRLSLDIADHVRIANPIAAGQELMRASLIPGLLRNIAANSRNFSSFRFFEIGMEIHQRGAELPNEIAHAAVVMYTREGDGVDQLFELKRVAECLMRGCEPAPAAPRVFEHPSRAAEVSWRGERVGRLFEVHPAFVPEGRAAILDVDLSRMLALGKVETSYRALRRFPTSAFDLSVVAPARSQAAAIEKQLTDLAGPNLVSIEFLRDYPLTPRTRSISFRLTVGAQDRTLSSDDLSAIRAAIIQGMAARGYELRV
ncbi:MAG TPA: phenylalanine--tRNA ligase subunit beta [Bryobacteraceae bacterium]|nr:phenylalanine--tRNA ligase subunit beta [Bryobacteraceae bacterium]